MWMNAKFVGAAGAILAESGEYDAATGFHADFVDARIADDCFPRGWRERLVPVPGFDVVFALSTADSAAAKLLATAFARLNRRMAAPRRIVAERTSMPSPHCCGTGCST